MAKRVTETGSGRNFLREAPFAAEPIMPYLAPQNLFLQDGKLQFTRVLRIMIKSDVRSLCVLP